MIAEAVRVSPEWLSLRDAGRRGGAVGRARRASHGTPRHSRPPLVHDLGGGSGAMGRWLAPRLPGPQHWVVHDRDADLLKVALAGAAPDPAADGTAVTVEGQAVRHHAPDAGRFAGASLVATASALLDLLTADALARVLVACAGCPMLLALTVVGRVTLTPEEPLDALMGAAFNAHQRRGRRLGPDAVAAAAGELRGAGAEVIVRPSPWRLDAAHADLAAEWLAAWLPPRVQQEPGVGRERPAPSATGAWRRRPPGSSPSPSTMPTCWCCRDAAVGPPRRAAATLAFLVWHLGAGPFLDGLGAVDGGALAAASGLAVLTTTCCAWRWKIVARGLGVDLPLGTAVAAYYRSLFLNVTLPGGVVGDVHRGWSHGRDTSDVGRGLRAVAWERSARQLVQVILTVAVLLALPSPVQAIVPFVALALIAVAAGVALAARVWLSVGRSRWARLRRAAARDLRDALLTRRAWPGNRPRVGARRCGPRSHVPDRRAERGGDRAAVRDAAAGAARDAGSGASRDVRRLGAARGRDRLGRSPPPGWARRLGSPPRSYMA